MAEAPDDASASAALTGALDEVNELLGAASALGVVCDEIVTDTLGLRARYAKGGGFGPILEDRSLDALTFLALHLRTRLAELRRRLDPPGGFAA